MKLLPVSSAEQAADFFTKPLHPKPFLTLLSKLGMVDIYQAPACERLLEHKEEEEVTCDASNLSKT